MSATDRDSPQQPAANGLGSPSGSPPPLRYTQDDSEKANGEWGASCGPHSLAAACGISLDDVRRAMPPFKGWMNPTMIGETLRTLGRSYTLRKGLKTQDLCEGINRLQWEGKWLDPGVPARVAYFHTHWVAQFNGWVLCTACLADEWLPANIWRIFVAQANKPFHVTHHYTITPPN